ncbi:hypothetical protein [Psychrobacillus sp. L3]
MLIKDMVESKITKVQVTELNEPNIKLIAQAFYDLIKNNQSFNSKS